MSRITFENILKNQHELDNQTVYWFANHTLNSIGILVAHDLDKKTSGEIMGIFHNVIKYHGWKLNHEIVAYSEHSYDISLDGMRFIERVINKTYLRRKHK